MQTQLQLYEQTMMKFSLKILALKKFGTESILFSKKIFINFLLLIGGLGLAPLLFAQTEFSKSREWLLLNKYQQILYNTYESQIDDPNFFLSPNGKKNPREEWIATFELFKKGEGYCRFPARLMLFQKFGYKFKTNFSHCEKYRYFLKQTNVKKVWIVFASYYVNNPASAFGHTFLRFQANEKKPSDLLDFTLDYSADVSPNENPIAYGVKGIVGSYSATYKLFPYYWKVREYRDGESRDLWEYELKLDPKQIKLLMAHLWELKAAKSDYFYFTENCSYHILGLIQAVTPDKKILKPLHKIVVPIDTLFALKDAKLLGETRFRPSIFSRLEKHWTSLDKNQKAQFEGLMEDSTKIFEVKDQQLFDAYIEYYDRKYYDKLLDDKSPEKIFKNKFLSKRTKLPVNKTKFNYDRIAPTKGHRSRRFTIGWDSDDKFMLQHKAALHQLIDPSSGYGKSFHMDMGEIQLKIKDDPQIQQMSLLKIKAYKPLTPINKSLSWDLDMLMRRDPLQDSLRGIINFSAGGAFDIANFLVYLGLTGEFESRRGLFRRGDTGVGPKLNLKFEYDKFIFVGKYQNLSFYERKDEIERTQLEFGYQVGKNWLTRLRYEFFNSVEVSEFTLSYYF